MGEGPGANEDAQGLPFVGRSGQLLDHYLEAIDLDRSKNIYIANIVKCRPPENRDPAPEESAACLPWLRMQSPAAAPKNRGVLGPHCRPADDWKRLFPSRGTTVSFLISRAHCLWQLCTRQALLRNPKSKISAFEDFVALREKIEQVCDHTYNRS